MISKIQKSFSCQQKAKKLIPGMSQLLSKRPDRFSYGVWPGYFSRAEGAMIWDLDGNEYLDMSIGGIGANILGYCDPDVDAAVMDAVKRGNSSSLNCPEEVELAELLCELHPWAKMVRYARTGGEAMAIAVRIARAATGRDVIAFCGYHGWHDWYLAANLGSEDALDGHLQKGLNPLGVPASLAGSAIPFTYNDLAGLKKVVNQVGKNLAAVVMEPIRNMEPDSGFIEGVMEAVEGSGAVLVIDEISAGFRLNTGGAHLLYGLIPHIAVFSKALGNGYPVAAIIGTSDIMEASQKTFISSTYWTERIGPVAALAMIEKHRSCNVSKHLNEIGRMVQDGWRLLGKRYGIPLHIKGIPPLSHFSIENERQLALRALYVQLMLDRGILATNMFYPMYAHTKEHIETYLKSTEECFKEMADAMVSGKVESKLEGAPALAGFKRLN